MTYLPTDKIRVFVSSRLEECAEERANARDAIASLNFYPVMFEAAGARPYPPRSIYLKGVESALFFVGIYKEGYGYVADGMEISGLEDEYRYAKALGKPQLLYVKKNCIRDEKLQKLISEFTGPSITVALYETPEELYDRLRDDMAALVTEYVFRGQRSRTLSPPESGAIADELVPPDRRVRRTHLETKLLGQLNNTPVVIVSGPIGAGKTVFLAALASQEEWVFVQCGDRTPREILVEATNGVRAKLGFEQGSFAQIEEARSALNASWQALESVTLVLDDVRTEEAANAVLGVIDALDKRRVVLSAREPTLLPGIAVFPLPPLERDEIRDFVKKNRAQPMISGELEELMVLPEGNPLYLRYYTSGKPRQFEETLMEYEMKAWRELAPRAREALNYVSLSTRPLQLEDLMDLMSSETGSVEEISRNLTEGRSLLSESLRGYSIFHPHAKKTIRSAVAESPQQLKFYVERLAKWFSSKRDYTAAFTVLDSVGANVSADLLELAGRHAAFQGDIGAALKILQRRIKMAREGGDAREVRDLMLSLANTQSHAGRTDEALLTLEEVRRFPVPGDSFVPVEEVELSILAWAKGDPGAIRGLTTAKQRYVEEGRQWDAARVALDLSASLIRRGDYRPAADEAEFALAAFEEHNDSYGARIAKLNLLSAASALPEKAEMASDLMRELESNVETSPRQRAALCNVLGRIARENNDIDGAKAYAREAIYLGRNLGDVSVVCTNLMNLGNAFRQEGDLDAALDQYEAADKIARESGLVQLEAWSQELIASVFNKKGDGQRAIQHARYAIGLAKGGVSKRTEAEAYEEMAEGCELINDVLGAREAWLQVAEHELSFDQESESGMFAFLRAARLLYKEGELRPYIDAYRKTFRENIRQSDDSLSNHEILVDEFPGLLACLPLKHAFEATVYHARLIFDGLPKVLARQVYLKLMERLVSLSNEQDVGLKRLRAALALSMALPRDTVTIRDMVDIGDHLVRYNSKLSFRAHDDGAAHWAVSVRFAKPVIITISQLDDRCDVSLVSLCLALVLLSFAEEISEEVLAGILPPRSEASIQVVNYDEAKQFVPLEKAGLHSMTDTCAVTRATDPKSEAGLPIIVITRGDLTTDWLVGGGRGNSGQILFAEVLVELVYHLFAGEIEIEALFPKVVSLVKKTVV